MYRLGVIPAGGKGKRWGGYLKEMLPVGNGTWMLDRTIEAMNYYGGANAILITTSKEKVGPLSNHLTDKHSIPIYYVVEDEGMDIWGGIVPCFDFPADRYMFAMPDTVYPRGIFTHVLTIESVGLDAKV